ncbi:MAG: response regulator [Candidatus Omnitrophica bacterium]|nr:response regulator [Candidatus Omnitrophota bacterium]
MKQKILLIDDEKDFCFFLKKNLESKAELEVTFCHSGEEGIRLAEELRPDLILLDIIMPGMDGSEVAAQLKSSSLASNIPVVFLTAVLTGKESEERDRFIGGWHYIGKPVDTNKLIDLINKLTSSQK